MHQEKGPQRDPDREFLFNFIKLKKNQMRKEKVF